MNPYWIDIDMPEAWEEAKHLYHWLVENKASYHRGPEDDRLFATGEMLYELDYIHLLRMMDKFKAYRSGTTFAYFTAYEPWLPHVDAHGRGNNSSDAKCSANVLFPVLNCDEATTTKWIKPEKDMWFDKARDAWRLQEDDNYEVLYERHVTTPGLLNTAIPHGVYRTDDRLRVVGVFAINSVDHISWEQAVECLTN